jgi:hypothetical protein
MTVLAERAARQDAVERFVPGTVHADPIMDDEKLWDIVSSGDLKGFTPKQRTQYYLFRCRQAGLDPSSQPFTYITFQGKGVLYANRTAADQLRKIHGISIENVQFEDDGEYLTYEITVRDRSGRSDHEVGVVFAGKVQGAERANARMKAMTKAKRRATYSICGLGMLDETEVEGVVWSVDDSPKPPTLATRHELFPDEDTLKSLTQAELGAHLKELRETLGWTAEDLRKDAAEAGRNLKTQEGAVEMALAIQEYILACDDPLDDDTGYPSPERPEVIDEAAYVPLEGMLKKTGVPGFAGDDPWTTS